MKNLMNIETELQTREFITDYVTSYIEEYDSINQKSMMLEIISELKRNYIEFRIGMITGIISKLTDKLIYNIS